MFEPALLKDYFWGGSSVAAVASQYGHVQLFNPAASGVLVIVKAVRASVGAAVTGQISLSLYDTALSTNVGTVANMYSGEAASAAQVRTATDASELGSAVDFGERASEDNLWIDCSPGLVIPANKGVLVVSSTVNISVFGYFKFREIAG